MSSPSAFAVAPLLNELADDRTVAGFEFRKTIRNYLRNSGGNSELVEAVVVDALEWARANAEHRTGHGEDRWRAAIYRAAKYKAQSLSGKEHRWHRRHQPLPDFDSASVLANPPSFDVDGDPQHAYSQSSESGELVRFLQQLEITIVEIPGMGIAGWERVRRRIRRSKNLQARVREQARDWAPGTPVDARLFVAPVLDGNDWATERLALGLTLSTVEAVRDGAYPNPTAAGRELTRFLATYQCPATEQICEYKIVAAGLVDHEHPRNRRAKAKLMAKGLRFTHHHVPQRPCTPGFRKCTEAPFGIRLDALTTAEIGGG